MELYAKYKLGEWTGPCVTAFQSGLHFVLDPSIVRIYSEEEFELALCGLSTIDIDEWQVRSMGQSMDCTNVHP